MDSFNDRLKQLRRDADLSQSDLAFLIGVSKSSINMYERGEREPGFETMERIADHFNVDMDFLYGRTDEPNRNKHDYDRTGKENRTMEESAAFASHAHPPRMLDGQDNKRPDMILFPARLKLLRLRDGMTQSELGKKVNKGESTVRMWELGKSEPDSNALTILAALFDVSVDYLLGIHNEGGPKKKLRSVARLESEDIPDDVDDMIRGFIDVFLSKHQDSGNADTNK